MMTDSQVVVHSEDRVGTIAFERPPVNALDIDLCDQLVDAFERVAARDDVNCVVLTGTRSHFSAGADVKELERLVKAGPAEVTRAKRRFMDLCQTVSQMPVPVVGAVNGYALGGGLGLLLSCDIRVASSEASFGFPEIQLGGTPVSAGRVLFPLIGRGQGMRLLLTGDRIDSKEAFRIGLIDLLAPASDAVATASDLAAKIARNPPQSVRACKAGLAIGAELGYNEARRLGELVGEYIAGTAGRGERLAAFSSKPESGPQTVG